MYYRCGLQTGSEEAVLFDHHAIIRDLQHQCVQPALPSKMT